MSSPNNLRRPVRGRVIENEEALILWIKMIVDTEHREVCGGNGADREARIVVAKCTSHHGGRTSLPVRCVWHAKKEMRCGGCNFAGMKAHLVGCMGLGGSRRGFTFFEDDVKDANLSSAPSRDLQAGLSTDRRGMGD
jgi:hypothetical protein